MGHSLKFWNDPDHDPLGGFKVPEWTFDHTNQFLGSGLKDCTGKEIFEGDIVKFGNFGRPFLVKFEQGAFWIENELLCKHASNLKVIGHKVNQKYFYNVVE